MTMQIWGAGTPRSFRPIWMAEELALDYELRPIGPRTGETQTAEYSRMNRKQKIPFLVDGDVHMSESLAICRYLANAYACDNLFIPSTARLKAKEDEWCCYIYGELDETSLYVMRRHGDLAEIYGASEQVIASCKAYLERHLTVLAEHLEAHDYLMESAFSLPDLLLMSCLDWAEFYGVSLLEPLKRYQERIALRPAYARAMQINYPELIGGLDSGTA